MPVWLTWKLIRPFVPYVAGVLAVLFVVWFLDHRGYQRAQQEQELANLRVKNEQAEMRILLDQKLSAMQTRMQEIISDTDKRLHEDLSNIEVKNRTIIQPTITREIRNAPTRVTDPDAGLTVGLRDAINAARATSGTNTPAPNR